MAGVKYYRVDGRKPVSYCSSISLVVFVGFSLVGVWLFMSSITPIQNAELPTDQGITGASQLRKNNYPAKSDTGESIQFKAQKNKNNTIKFSDDVTEGNQKEMRERSDEKSVAEMKSGMENGNDVKENSESGELNSGDGLRNSDINVNASKSHVNEKDKMLHKPENIGEMKKEDMALDQTTNSDTNKNRDVDTEKKPGDVKTNKAERIPSSNEIFPVISPSEVSQETNSQGGNWSTQHVKSENENEINHTWKLCNVTARSDYIPCLDNWESIKKLRSTKHYEHRERHCPEMAPTCLVPLPKKYRSPVRWPESRDRVWFDNVPHTVLAEYKKGQNWVKVSGEYLTFPGGGTQFKRGAVHYIEFIEESIPDIAWGNRSRVILDVGCGVASFGGYLFDKDVLTMSLAPKDEHEAQVQFALERGIPAILGVMGTVRLPFPSSVFDLIHCARCRVPWHIEGGKLLLEINRLLRPGGHFVWSATPVYKKGQEDVAIWNAMSALTKSICWDLLVIKRDKVNNVAAAIFRKPTSNDCHNRRENGEPPLCDKSADPNAAWNVTLQSCIYSIPENALDRGSMWPPKWPERLEKPPYWLNSTSDDHGRFSPVEFIADHKHWKQVVKLYLDGMGIDWSSVRNVMDMNASYGGFAAALEEVKVWVMNVVPVSSTDTLPIIYERGLFGIYHDWCESFNTYPRTYDLLHADNLFSNLKKRCNLLSVIAEVDRILRPEGKVIIHDDVETLRHIESITKSLHWETLYSKDEEGLLCVQKTFWRPTETETIYSAIVRV